MRKVLEWLSNRLLVEDERQRRHRGRHGHRAAAAAGAAAHSSRRRPAGRADAARFAKRHAGPGSSPAPNASPPVLMPGEIDAARAYVEPRSRIIISGLATLRDRALIAFGIAPAARRSELVALDVTDLAWEEKGLRMTIRCSKTDQEGAGAVAAVPEGCRLPPLADLRAWLKAARHRREAGVPAALEGQPHPGRAPCDPDRHGVGATQLPVGSMGSPSRDVRCNALVQDMGRDVSRCVKDVRDHRRRGRQITEPVYLPPHRAVETACGWITGLRSIADASSRPCVPDQWRAQFIVPGPARSFPSPLSQFSDSKTHSLVCGRAAG